MIDTEGTIPDVNQAYCTMSGYTRKDLLYRNILDIEDEHSHRQIHESIQIIKETGHYRFITRHRKKDNTPLDTEVSSTLLQQGKGQFVCIIRDIGESFIHYERYKHILNSMNSIIYIADMETYEILFINDYTRSIQGECTGKVCWQALQKGLEGPCPFCTNRFLL